MAFFFIQAVKTLKVTSKDFHRFIKFTKQHLIYIDNSKENILLVIDLLIYHVPLMNDNTQDEEELFLKTNILNHFPSSQGLCDITYQILNDDTNVSQNVENIIYGVNFCNEHKIKIEKIVDAFLADENVKTQNGESYTTKIEFNSNIYKIIELYELLVVIKSLQTNKYSFSMITLMYHKMSKK